MSFIANASPLTFLVKIYFEILPIRLVDKGWDYQKYNMVLTTLD